MCGVWPPTEGRVCEKTRPPPRSPGPQGRRARTALSSGASSLPPEWFLNSFSAGIRSRGPRKEALLPHSLPIRTPETQGTTPHPCLQEECRRPGA